jgi:hypothetical protein
MPDWDTVLLLIAAAVLLIAALAGIVILLAGGAYQAWREWAEPWAPNDISKTTISNVEANDHDRSPQDMRDP